MKSSYLLLACATLLSFPLASKALDYPSALPNSNLEEELKNQSDRMVPKSEWFSAAADGQVYFRNLSVNDFYHGTGYWVQARTEFRPSQYMTLNVRSIFYSGSISGGYTNPTGQYNLLGFSATWPKPIFGGTASARAIDIERQTIGEGLLIEEKEMAGVWVKWARDDHYLKVLKEGTGGLVMGDDLSSVEAKLFGGYIGGGMIFWTASVEQSKMDQNRKPFYFLNSTHSLGQYVDYFAEVGYRFSKLAAMVGLKNEGSVGRFKYKSRVQVRSYQENVGNEFVGMIENMYVSYDQYNKRYTNASNVFVTDDNVNVYSLIADVDYEINHEWTLQSKNEVGTFDFKNSANKGYYFYRFGATYFPLVDREESITLFASNKVLTDSFSRPPSDYSLGKNLPLFRQRGFYGIEANFRF